MTEQDFTSWYVGMKVVCVGGAQDGARQPQDDEIRLRRGHVYTIRDISLYRGIPAIRVVEVVNKPRPYRMEDGSVRVLELKYHARCFRPVVTRKTDISIFTAMLNPSNQRVDA